MMSLARLALERVARGLQADLDVIPPWQWAIYFEELSRLCPSSLPVVAGAMARVAVQQFNDAVAELAPRFEELLRFAPRGRVEAAEVRWSGVTKRLLPASKGAQRVLSAGKLQFELDPVPEGG